MWLFGIDGTGGVEVTIWLLSLADNIYERINISFQFFIGKQAQRKRSAFNSFLNVSLIEGICGADLTGVCCRHYKIIYPAGAFAPCK